MHVGVKSYDAEIYLKYFCKQLFMNNLVILRKSVKMFEVDKSFVIFYLFSDQLFEVKSVVIFYLFSDQLFEVKSVVIFDLFSNQMFEVKSGCNLKVVFRPAV